MKKLLLSVLCIMAATQLFAQKLEVTAGAYTGLMQYGGKSESVNATSFLLITNPPYQDISYTNNPYGTKTGTGFGGYGQAQLVSKKGFIVGLQAGYEQLKSKVDITQVYVTDMMRASPADGPYAASGSTSLKTNFVNINPYIGYRLPVAVVDIDILAGMDFGFITSSRENGKATANGTTYTTNIDRKDIKNDKRLRFGAAATYHRIAFNASYAYGLSNYQEGYIGGPAREAHTKVIRLGLSYRIF
jgi:hypothetical protein